MAERGSYRGRRVSASEEGVPPAGPEAAVAQIWMPGADRNYSATHDWIKQTVSRYRHADAPDAHSRRFPHQAFLAFPWFHDARPVIMRTRPAAVPRWSRAGYLGCVAWTRRLAVVQVRLLGGLDGVQPAAGARTGPR